jgi:hypothetical protein
MLPSIFRPLSNRIFSLRARMVRHENGIEVINYRSHIFWLMLCGALLGDSLLIYCVLRIFWY